MKVKPHTTALKSTPGKYFMRSANNGFPVQLIFN